MVDISVNGQNSFLIENPSLTLNSNDKSSEPHSRFLSTTPPSKRVYKQPKSPKLEVSTFNLSFGEAKCATTKKVAPPTPGSYGKHSMGFGEQQTKIRPPTSPGFVYKVPSTINSPSKSYGGPTYSMGTAPRFAEPVHLGTTPVLGPGAYYVPSDFEVPSKPKEQQRSFGTSERFSTSRISGSPVVRSPNSKR